MTHTIIIGGTRGVGRELAKVLAARGDQVSVIGRRDPQEGDRENPRLRYSIADLTDGGAVQSALDDLIHASGKPSYVAFCQRFRGKDDDWSGEFAVSLTATKTTVEAVQDRFETSGDCAIAMVSSVFGTFVGEGQPISYHVAKAGIEQMARYYAVTLGRKGIRANTVTPFTFLKEESREFYLKNEALQSLYKTIIPLGRMGTTEDVANAVAYLCSPQAAFVNGQNLFVDGGLSLVWPENLARKLAAV
jgi:NAD(P)-dependent dehydrogenase (short-subunit alcohol dehydrogenase family)